MTEVRGGATGGTKAGTETLPLVQVGWLMAADERDPAFKATCTEARDRLKKHLERMFPEFHWEMTMVNRRRFPPRGALNPLSLLELGVETKFHLGWDYALVVVPNGLDAPERTGTGEIASSALEVGIASTEVLAQEGELADILAARAVRLLGHLWGLPKRDDGPMACETSRLLEFSEMDRKTARLRLREVSDERLEERDREAGRRLGAYLRAFLADPRGILTDILGYSPWRFPLRMGRLTAAATVSIIVFLLGAESWEIGVNIEEWPLGLVAVLSIVAATIFLFAGQNLVGLSAGDTRVPREQFLRMRIVLFVTLLLGMCALWLLLAVGAFAFVLALPEEVPARWLGSSLRIGETVRYCVFLATLGVLAGALGGSLEAERKFKAMLYFDDDET